MTRLLVSVRDVTEAKIAVSAGADLIDVKEPRLGSLGAADSKTIAAIAELVARSVPLSVAMGELLDQSRTDFQSVPITRFANRDRIAADMHGTDWKSVLLGVQFAKVGLAGCKSLANWPELWKVAIDCLPSGTYPVAVVYADPDANSPDSATVTRFAAEFGCKAVLVDTWKKSAGPLTAHWSLDRIHSFVLDIQLHGMMAVVGGGLTIELIEQIMPACPDVIAVRGAACRGDRTGKLDSQRVRLLRELVASHDRQSSLSFA